MATGMFGDPPPGERSRSSRSRRPVDQTGYNPSSSVPQQNTVVERPRTSKGRRSARKKEPIHHSTYVPSALEDESLYGRGGPMGSMAANHYISVEHRPTTSKGFRDIQDSDFDMKGYEGEERPKTSRGRRNQDVDSYMIANEAPSEPPPPERPKTSHGKRSRTAQPQCEVGPVYENPPLEAEVNILKLDTEEKKTETVVTHSRKEGITRPKSRYGQRRQVSQVQQQTCSTQQQIPHGVPMKATEPQPDWTGRHPSASHPYTRETLICNTPSPQPPTSPNRPGSNRQMRSSCFSDQEPGSGSASPGSRPTSAGSLSKYSILPSIPRTPQRRGSAETKKLNRQVDRLTLGEETENISLTENTETQNSAKPATIPTLYPVKQKTAEKTEAESKDKQEAEKKSDENRKDGAGTKADETHSIESTPTMHKALKRVVKLPEEPNEEKPRILLAVKLPSGQRIQRHFNETDHLNVVLNFAEVSSELDFTGYHIICDAPRKIFSDMNVTLSQSGLQNRTVLHIQLPDE